MFVLNYNKSSVDIKLDVNYICLNEWLCMMQIFFCAYRY